MKLYVDYLLMACNDKDELGNIMLRLCINLTWSTLAKYFFVLGVEICSKQEMSLMIVCHLWYAQIIIERFGRASAKGQTTPMDDNALHMQDAELCMEPYCEVVGCIVYLLVDIRPDLAYSVWRLPELYESSATIHCVAMQRVLNWILNTKDFGLRYRGPSETFVPMAYVDGDRAGDVAIWKPVSGCLVMITCAAVSWFARQRDVVALSGIASMYDISLNRGLEEPIPVVPCSWGPTPIHVDNQGCIRLTLSVPVKERRKHIDVEYHYTSKDFADDIACLRFCHSNQMTADMWTKQFGKITLRQLVTNAGLRDCREALTQGPQECKIWRNIHLFHTTIDL